ncbi:MAG: bifunctional methylenetetrahydrofolate dehydrogenase/methenyltetrahydrofolate cyclohydrolase FolD [Planctomycetota bacterium]
MSADRLDGKETSKVIQAEIKQQVSQFIDSENVVPKLAAVLVGEDPASQVYVRNKERSCARVGIGSQLFRMPADSTTDEVLSQVVKLNSDESVHGILVQLPLPDGVDAQKILDAIDPDKDVDAFHPHNVGLISQGRPRYLPCTPHGILQLLKRHDISAAGKHVVIVGRSDIVGKPMGMMLMGRDAGLGSEFANATVTICHSRTENLDEFTQTADILIAAIGKAEFISADMVKPGAVVIDVGINRTEDGLVGDVAYEEVSEVASAITPVPGGVGPLTVTMLLANTLAAAEHQVSSTQTRTT